MGTKYKKYEKWNRGLFDLSKESGMGILNYCCAKSPFCYLTSHMT